MLVDKSMKSQNIDQWIQGYDYNELLLTRNVLLAHLFDGNIPPGDVVRHASRFSLVTYWEELVCAAFYPQAGKLMAIVSIRQLDGYSGMLRRHGSMEYVRFFVDWADGNGYQAVGLSHFKVCDLLKEENKQCYPLCHLVKIGLNTDRYWDAVIEGHHPTVRAVLSWNQVPEIDPEFTPIFGNRINSQISIDSEKELISHFEVPQDKEIWDRERAPYSAPHSFRTLI